MVHAAFKERQIRFVLVTDLPIVAIVMNDRHVEELGQAPDVIARVDQQELRKVLVVAILKKDELGLDGLPDHAAGCEKSIDD
jgi:hypothetical protein